MAKVTACEACRGSRYEAGASMGGAGQIEPNQEVRSVVFGNGERSLKDSTLVWKRSSRKESQRRCARRVCRPRVCLRVATARRCVKVDVGRADVRDRGRGGSWGVGIVVDTERAPLTMMQRESESRSLWTLADAKTKAAVQCLRGGWLCWQRLSQIRRGSADQKECVATVQGGRAGTWLQQMGWGVLGP